MFTQGNKIPVRIEGHNVQADWYRLRDLFAEQPATVLTASLPPLDTSIPWSDGEVPDTDLAIRGRLLLTGQRGRQHQVTELGRSAAIAALNSDDSPITGTGSAVRGIMNYVCPDGWNYRPWELEGNANSREFNARWLGLQPDGIASKFMKGDRRLTEARLHVELAAQSTQADNLIIQLDILLTNSERLHSSEQLERDLARLGEKEADTRNSRTDKDRLGHFINLGIIGLLLLDTLGTLWGPPGEALSISVLAQPLGPPAQLDAAVFTVSLLKDSKPLPLNAVIGFGDAKLIPGNIPRAAILLGSIEPDRNFTNRAEQGKLVLDWLTRLGIENGYQDIGQEVARYTDLTS